MARGEGQGEGRGEHEGTCGNLCMLLLAFFLPPVSVFLAAGCGMDLLINIVLTCLMFLPGMIHAFWVVLREKGGDQ